MYNSTMYTVGKILRKIREHLGYSIYDVSRAINVKPEYLKCIEKDDFSCFKSVTFARGFVRSYASFIGADVEKILALFRRQIGEFEEPIKVKGKIETPKGLTLSPVHLAFMALFVFFAAIILYMLKLYFKVQQPPKFKILEPPREHFVVDKPEFTIKGVTEPKTVVKINDKQIGVEPDHTFVFKTALKPGENLFTIEVYREHLPDRKSIKKIVLEYKPTNKPGETKASKNESKTAFKLELTDRAWIQIVADNVQVAVGIKPKGYVKEFKASKEVIVKSGVPTATKLYVDGKLQHLDPQKAFSGGWRCINKGDGFECN